ncbi:hypothetical protein GO285_05367 [Ralstonia solanacearum]|nr:hypothetical protein [Ralstonia solanacearum]NKF87762.1 hypothetical protein [Ralstonia solanacearum]NKG13533.1 hypothetical protein [Ralstonia solanacearum]
MAASVGPYRLCSSECGKRARLRCCNACGKASPLHSMRRKPWQRPASTWSRNSCSIDGTKCNVVIPACSIVAAR